VCSFMCVCVCVCIKGFPEKGIQLGASFLLTASFIHMEKCNSKGKVGEEPLEQQQHQLRRARSDC